MLALIRGSESSPDLRDRKYITVGARGWGRAVGSSGAPGSDPVETGVDGVDGRGESSRCVPENARWVDPQLGLKGEPSAGRGHVLGC